MVEVHHDPDHALSDGQQSITPDQFATLMSEVKQIAAVLERGVVAPVSTLKPMFT
jgi:3-deoxy-7-phosphoheptulonate synthase